MIYNFTFLYYGLLAILTQLITFRELAVLFYGNELFLGAFLSSWLLWAGSGSILIRRILKDERLKAEFFSRGFFLLALLLPYQIISIRISKNLFAFGELIGPVGTTLFTFCVMAPLCFIIGGQFSLACSLASHKEREREALGRVYIYEVLGSVIGGVLFTYALIGRIPLFIIALMLSLGCVICGVCLLKGKKTIHRILLAAGVLAALLISLKAEPQANKIQWKRYRLIRQKEARNATISLVEMGSIKNVFIDGMISASFPNPEDYEPLAHWPLLATPDPRSILILGEGSLGALKEALKHSPQVIDYVMLDNSFLSLVLPYAQPEDVAALNDPRVNIHYGDARLFIKNKKEGSYDAIIINIREVTNLKLNRFYAREFYSLAKSILNPKGILALNVSSSENYLSPSTRIFNASVYQTLESVFTDTQAIPGDSLIFLSSPSAIAMQEKVFLERYAQRKISNRNFVPSFIKYKLGEERRSGLKKILHNTTAARINRDFKPTAYYYFSNLWLNKFASPLGYLLLGLFLTFAAFIIFRKKSPLAYLAARKECVLIFAFGFMGINLELMFLFAFQIISGYVYWQMGVLFASFMLGLFLGAASGMKFKGGKRKTHITIIASLSLAIIILTLAAGYLLPRLINLSPFWNMLVFPALLISTGAIVGAAFIIASFLMVKNEILRQSGWLYAADLWGAATGAMLCANLMVPCFGLSGALNFSAILGFTGLTVFLIMPEGLTKK